MNDNLPFFIQEEVEDALSRGRGVVALESTVIAHGLPYPYNFDTTSAMIAAIREEGSVPALIAIIDGVVTVGMSSALIERLADPKASVLKVSRRDLAYAIAKKAVGATTVSATMLIASMAGIKVFATGGIGGVHRGALESMDISADIMELSKTPVAVVCAGAKSILDIAKTLEMLETNGVPVIGYGSDFFPEFYSVGHKHKLSMRCDTPREAALIARLHLGMNQGGLVIAQPIDEQDALPPQLVEEIIAHAIIKAQTAHIRGKEVTPFLLAEIARGTKEESIRSNCSLLIKNARLASRIAKISG